MGFHDSGGRGGRGGFGGGGGRPMEFHKATCAECNEECEVPFKPSGDRPVYCKDCFSKRKNTGRQFSTAYYIRGEWLLKALLSGSFQIFPAFKNLQKLIFDRLQTRFTARGFPRILFVEIHVGQKIINLFLLNLQLLDLDRQSFQFTLFFKRQRAPR